MDDERQRPPQWLVTLDNQVVPNPWVRKQGEDDYAGSGGGGRAAEVVTESRRPAGDAAQAEAVRRASWGESATVRRTWGAEVGAADDLALSGELAVMPPENFEHHAMVEQQAAATGGGVWGQGGILSDFLAQTEGQRWTSAWPDQMLESMSSHGQLVSASIPDIAATVQQCLGAPVATWQPAAQFPQPRTTAIQSCESTGSAVRLAADRAAAEQRFYNEALFKCFGPSGALDGAGSEPLATRAGTLGPVEDMLADLPRLGHPEEDVTAQAALASLQMSIRNINAGAVHPQGLADILPMPQGVDMKVEGGFEGIDWSALPAVCLPELDAALGSGPPQPFPPVHTKVESFERLLQGSDEGALLGANLGLASVRPKVGEAVHEAKQGPNANGVLAVKEGKSGVQQKVQKRKAPSLQQPSKSKGKKAKAIPEIKPPPRHHPGYGFLPPPPEVPKEIVAMASASALATNNLKLPPPAPLASPDPNAPDRFYSGNTILSLWLKEYWSGKPEGSGDGEGPASDGGTPMGFKTLGAAAAAWPDLHRQTMPQAGEGLHGIPELEIISLQGTETGSGEAQPPAPERRRLAVPGGASPPQDAQPTSGCAVSEQPAPDTPDGVPPGTLKASPVAPPPATGGRQRRGRKKRRSKEELWATWDNVHGLPRQSEMKEPKKRRVKKVLSALASGDSSGSRSLSGEGAPGASLEELGSEL